MPNLKKRWFTKWNSPLKKKHLLLLRDIWWTKLFIFQHQC